MTRNKTTLLQKKNFSRSVRVREVSSVLTSVKSHSVYGPLRIEIPHDKKGRKSTAYSMDPSFTRI